ncbi:hypothetical protein BN871_AQ_00040 [Paenibacillus sp. P22]|nr:hypothetical protein BN871_AQ_00040 [Paenibacillus sp. P22]
MKSLTLFYGNGIVGMEKKRQDRSIRSIGATGEMDRLSLPAGDATAQSASQRCDREGK